MKPTDFTPQSFESNDGRFSISVYDDGCLELIMTEYTSADKEYYTVDDSIQKLYFESNDLESLIKVLTLARKINPHSWKNISK